MTQKEWLMNEVKEDAEYMKQEEYPGVESTLRDVLDFMTPKEMEIEGGGWSWCYVCPECHGVIDQKDSFCRHCGQAVKK
jgi:hypothetical protein